MTSPAIALSRLTKTFGRTTAVRQMDLEIPPGALYGFIGPNGAGKTTTIRMIMSIFFPDSGTVSVLGHRTALDAKDRIGYLPEERGVYRKMRVGAFLQFMARLKGVRGDLGRLSRSLLERLDLGHTFAMRCEELSKGMLQKVQFLAAVVHTPDLLILDEPFSGLDPVSMRLLRDLVLEEHGRGATILFSTHVMPQAEEICGNIVMIHHGRKVLDAPLADIRNRYDPRRLAFEPLDPGADLSLLAARVPGIERIVPHDGGHQAHLAEGTDPVSTMRRILERLPVARIELARPRLEDVFVEIVTGGADEAGEAQSLRAAVTDAEPAT